MTTTCLQKGRVAFEINGMLLCQDGSHRLESYSEVDVLSVADATLNATTVIGQRCDVLAIGRYKHIVLFASPGGDSLEAFTILETLDGVDAQHRCTQLGVQLVELRLAQSPWTALDDASDDTANGVAFSLDGCDEIFHLLRLLLVWTAHDVVLYRVEVILVVISVEGDVAYL